MIKKLTKKDIDDAVKEMESWELCTEELKADIDIEIEQEIIDGFDLENDMDTNIVFSKTDAYDDAYRLDDELFMNQLINGTVKTLSWDDVIG